MTEYQLYSNGKIITYIDVNSKAFKKEENQILSQEFTRLGELIQAESPKEAIEKYKEYDRDNIKGLTLLSVLSCLLS